MSWASITESDLLTAISGAELTTYRSHSLAIGQADPVQPTIDGVTALVRGYCSKVMALGAAGTIPGSLLMPALDIVAYRMSMRAGKSPSSERKAAHDKALQLLQDVADRKFRVEEDTAAPISITAPDRQATRAKLSGL